MATKQTNFACLASILLIGMASCSQEELLNNEPNAPRKTIGFNVTADRASRATGIYTSANIPEQFTIGAWYHTDTPEEGTLYIANDCVKKTNGVYENVTDLRYWPTNPGEKLDFFAYQSGTTDNAEDFHMFDRLGNYNPVIHNFETPMNAHLQRDLVYACAYNQTESQARVQLTFKHALAQIGIQAKNESRHIHVEIEEIALGGTMVDNNFYFGNGSPTDLEKANTRWEDTEGAWFNAVCFSPMGIVNPETHEFVEQALVLTDKTSDNVVTTHDLTPDDIHKFLLMPQSNKPAMEDGVKDFAGNTINGSYFRIKCKIWNIADPTLGFVTQKRMDDYNAAGLYWEDDYPGVTPDVKIHDGYLYIPYAFNWEMGQKYTYTISFGKGTAGYDGQGNPTFVKVEILEPNVEAWKENTFTDKKI